MADNLISKEQDSIKSQDDCKRIILQAYKIEEQDLQPLGEGNEGYTWLDTKANQVYKALRHTPVDIETANYNKFDMLWRLQSFQESMDQYQGEITTIPKVVVAYLADSDSIILRYPYVETQAPGNKLQPSRQSTLKHLREMKRLGWTNSDFQPKNYRVTAAGDILYIDIGNGFHSYSEKLHASLIRRAFVTYKMLNSKPELSKLEDVEFKKKFLTIQNSGLDLVPVAEELGKPLEIIQKQFDEFSSEALDERLEPTVESIEQAIEAFVNTQPFHNLFLLYGLGEEVQNSELGGTCSDRSIFLKKELESKFLPTLAIDLHRADINGKRTHTLLRLTFNHQVYFAEVGMGLPISSLIPEDKACKFDCYGKYFHTVLADHVISVRMQEDRAGSREILSIPIGPMPEETVLTQIKDRFKQPADLPFSNSLRYYFVHRGKFYKIHDDDSRHGQNKVRINTKGLDK